MLSRKHYVVIARIISETGGEGANFLYKDELIQRLVNYYQADNPNFDCNKFIRACGEEQK